MSGSKIAAALGMVRSTVGAILRRLGLGRLSAVRRAGDRAAGFAQLQSLEAWFGKLHERRSWSHQGIDDAAVDPQRCAGSGGRLRRGYVDHHVGDFLDGGATSKDGARSLGGDEVLHRVLH